MRVLKHSFDFQILDYSLLSQPSKEDIRVLLDKIVVIKLNGGLGTFKGCKGPQSSIIVRDDSSLLDLTVQQIDHLNQTFNANIPLILMNSFNTDLEIKKVIKKYTGIKVPIFTFNQSKYPRIDKDTLLPIPKKDADAEG